MRNLVHPDERAGNSSTRWGKVLLGSVVFHLFLLGLVTEIILWERTSHRAIASGSPEAVMTLSLSKAAPPSRPAVPPPPAPAPPKPVEPTPVPPALVAAKPIPEKPKPTPPDQGVPVLAVHPKTAAAPPRPTSRTLEHVSPTTRETSASSAHLAPVASSFTAGQNAFPHPPYPEEARERREIGTVRVTVQFDTRGRVATVEITQSSGSLILDQSTTAFIRANWHSLDDAGQTVSVPVRYSLEEM